MTNIHEDWICRKCKCPNSDMISVCKNCGTHAGGSSVSGILILAIAVVVAAIVAAYVLSGRNGEDKFPIIDDVRSIGKEMI